MDKGIAVTGDVYGSNIQELTSIPLEPPCVDHTWVRLEGQVLRDRKETPEAGYF